MTPGQSGSRSDANEGILCIPQSSSITGTSPSDCLVSYPGHPLGVGTYPSAEKQLVYSTAPADWARMYALNVCVYIYICKCVCVCVCVCIYIYIYIYIYIDTKYVYL